jgi:Undecaprenyl-phosphate glucose phosphotransferase
MERRPKYIPQGRSIGVKIESGLLSSAGSFSAMEDVLGVWDFTSIFCAGYLLALAHDAWFGPSVLSASRSEFGSFALRFSLIGGLLAPLVLRGSSGPTERDRTAAGMIRRTTPRIIMMLTLLLVIGFLTKTLIYMPRIWIVAWSTEIFGAAIVGRLMLMHYVNSAAARGLLRSRVAIVGDAVAAQRAQQQLFEASSSAVEIVGIFQDTVDGPADDGGLAGLIEIGKREKLDRIVLAIPDADAARLHGVVRHLKALDVDIALYSQLLSECALPTRLDQLGGVSMLVIAGRPIRRWGLVFKAFEDKFLGALLVIMLLPLMAIIALNIKLDSPGPILFRQRRHGWNNREFEVFKFRTMTVAPDYDDAKLQQTRRNDQRITRVGRFLRESSLDELPQLFNVLLGDMSLVGPRPHPIAMRTEERLGTEIIAEYSHRHRVKPGITGWAQIRGFRGATTTEAQVRQRVEHDIYYIENWSVFFDIKILALTPLRILLDRGNAF